MMDSQAATNFNGIGAAAIVCLCLLILLLPKRYSILPIVVGVCYLTLGQILLVGPFHFYTVRILILFGLLRVFIRRETRSVVPIPLDRTTLLFVTVCSIAYSFQWMNLEGIINRLGFAFNILGLYFLFRVMLDNREDVLFTYRFLSVAMVPLALLFLLEASTGRNVFSVFGGIPDITMIRDGKLRCQGPFRHPILAGTFAATLIPVLAAKLARRGDNRWPFLLGFLSSVVIVVASNSSGPVLAVGFSVIGFLLWRYRRKMRMVRISLVLGIVSLHLVMKAPVWSLIGRVSNLIGGTGYHRVELIDAAIGHFDEWWMIGTNVTAHWLDDPLPDDPSNIDITNQYIFVGISGGLLSLYYFLKMLKVTYGMIGELRKHFETADPAMELFVWGCGVSLFAHIASFISVVYFDQMIVFFYLLLASVATMYVEQRPSFAPPVKPRFAGFPGHAA